MENIQKIDQNNEQIEILIFTRKITTVLNISRRGGLVSANTLQDTVGGCPGPYLETPNNVLRKTVNGIDCFEDAEWVAEKPASRCLALSSGSVFACRSAIATTHALSPCRNSRSSC